MADMYKSAESFLNKNSILYAGLLQVIQRETAEILEASEDGVFLRDTVSDCFMLAADNIRLGEQWLKAHGNRRYPLLLLFQKELVRFAEAYCRLSPMMECFQAVYIKEKLPARRGNLTIRPADIGDFSFVSSHYGMVSAEELTKIIRRGRLFIGSHDGKPVGFIGEHLEGSMGLLEILPGYRGKGYGTELESFMICHMLEKGQRPFCQIETDNSNSMRLQRKLGLTISEERMYWME